MTDGLTTTHTRSDPDTDPVPARPADASGTPDLTAFWTALSEMAAAQTLRHKAVRALRGGERSATGRARPTFLDGVRSEFHAQCDELRRLVAAVRDLDVDGWLDAVRNRIATRWRAVRRGPSAEAESEAADGATALPPRWSAVVPEWSSLATQRHYSQPDPSAAPAPLLSPRRPALTRGLAAAVAATAVGAVTVIATAPAVDRPVVRPAPAVAPAPPSPTAAAPSSSTRAPAPRPATVSTATLKGAGHAELHRDTGRFVLYDDRRDGRSAVLQFTVGGTDRQTRYNVQGISDATHPPEQFLVSGLTASSAVTFRVCTAAPGAQVKEQNCGAWTKDPAS